MSQSTTAAIATCDPIDKLTFAHAVAGLFVGLTSAPISVAVALAVGWEVLERYLQDRVPEAFSGSPQDRIQNSIIDACAVLLGWGIGLQLRKRSNV